MGLAIFKGSQDRLKGEAIGSGKSHGTCHFWNVKMASPMGLAIFHFRKGQVPWDLPILIFKNGKSHATCQFWVLELASPMGLAIFKAYQDVSTENGKSLFWNSRLSQWQVPRDLPFPKNKMASPMGLATSLNYLFQPVSRHCEMASPMGLAISYNFLSQPVSRHFENGKSNGTCHFL